MIINKNTLSFLKAYISFVFCFNGLVLFAQETQKAATFNLNIPISFSSSYEAKNQITLLPGFSFAGNETNEFDGKINTALATTSYNTTSPVGDLTEGLETGYKAAVGHAAPPGTLPGAVDVSPTGAASYSIPLQVSSGVGSMTPQLAVEYNSQSGRGVLGLGWNLNGISAITRAPQNKYYDDKNLPVSFSLTDRFALDGQRLILNLGTYGAAGSTYDKESLDFSTITAVGTAGNGPSSFKVVTSDGATFIYGGGTSNVLIPTLAGATDNTTVMAWPLSSVTDSRGNKMEFIYENTADGQIKLTRIDYNKNIYDTNIPALSISFTYETFANNYSYVGDRKCNNNLKLTTVTLPDDKKYSFVYDNEKLSEVGYYIGSTPVCAPTVITWGAAPDYSKFQITNEENRYDLENKNRLYFGDFDGDGVKDIVMCDDINGTISVTTKDGAGETYNVPIPHADTPEETQAYFDVLTDVFILNVIAQKTNTGKD